MARTHALNVITVVNDNSDEVKVAMIRMINDAGKIDRRKYDLRIARILLLEWGFEPGKYGFDW